MALDQEYLAEAEFRRPFEQATRTGQMVSGLVGYLQSAGLRGSKFGSSAARRARQP